MVCSEAVPRRCSVKKLFLKILQNVHENTCARVSFLIKLQVEACNFIKKETLAQVFFCEFCKIFKNSFFNRTPPVAASSVDKTYFSDCNGIRTQNHLFRKRTLNLLSKLAKLACCCSHLNLRYRTCFEEVVP